MNPSETSVLDQDQQAKKPTRKLAHEELFNNFDLHGRIWLNELPELRSLLLVADWQIGQSDLPPCFILTKNLTEQTNIELLRQTIKSLETLTNLFKEKINQASSTLKQAEELLKKSNNQ